MNFNPNRLLVSNGRADNILLIAGVSSIGNVGGLYSFDGFELARIDVVSTAALDFDGSELVRLLVSGLDLEVCSELLFYDEVGVRRYFRIDALPDAHDVRYVNGSVLCVSTMANSILWVSKNGEVERVWRAPGEKDSWHVNAAVEHGGKIYCTAFGIFRRFREWNEQGRNTAGILYNVTDDGVELSGFDCPHSPLWLEPEGWVLCNSGTSEVLNIPPGSQGVKQRVQLDHWTRGLAASDDYFFVGESADRKKLYYGAAAHLAIVDRKSWKLCERIALPFTEVTSIALVPDRYVAGLKRGFRVNSLREDELSRVTMFQKLGSETGRSVSLMEALPREALKSKIMADVRPAVIAGIIEHIPVTVRNMGTGILHSQSPYPVNLSYRWYLCDDSSVAPIEGQRMNLPRLLHPDGELSCTLAVIVPKQPGDYELAISLVQEWVAWFDEVDAKNGFRTKVRVRTA